MKVLENVPFSTLTTFKAGGIARFVAPVEREEEVVEALAFASSKNLPWYVLGEGSNIVPPEQSYQGVLIHIKGTHMTTTHINTNLVLDVWAGTSWDALVTYAAEESVWGIENLAGIPGTVGAAPVQNIGAYGSELKDCLVSVRAFDTTENVFVELQKEACGFGYRDSIFKKDARYIITRVRLTLKKNGTPHLSYPDLAHLEAQRETLTPAAVGDAVRLVRGRKFPDLRKEGTAGSFFKNPVLSAEAYAALKEKYPELPGYPQEAGVKVPLAYILDRILSLKGYHIRDARLFENQPLVVVLKNKGNIQDVALLARDVEARVYDAIGIHIEREVRTIS